MSVRDSSPNESYFENIVGNYNDEVIKILQDQANTGNNAMYKYYLEWIDSAAAQVGLKVRACPQAIKLAIGICFHLEDNAIKELGADWIIENYDRNTDYFKLIFVERPAEQEPEVIDPKEYVPSPVVEVAPEPTTAEPFTPDFLDKIVELKRVRDRQIKDLIEEITTKFVSSDFATTADVVSVMAENKALRQMIVAMLERANISFSTTAQGSLPLEVYTKTTQFKQGIPYTLEHLKFGYANFGVKLDEQDKIAAEHRELKTQIKSLESKNHQAVSEATRLRTSLETIGQENEALQAIPKLTSATPLQFRIAWDDDGERYYLGTSASPDERNAQGLYKVKSLTKSPTKKGSLIFKDLDTLRAQLERAIENYKFINRTQYISLVHLKAAYVVETLEHINTKAARRPAVQKSISIGKK